MTRHRYYIDSTSQWPGTVGVSDYLRNCDSVIIKTPDFRPLAHERKIVQETLAKNLEVSTLNCCLYKTVYKQARSIHFWHFMTWLQATIYSSEVSKPRKARRRRTTPRTRKSMRVATALNVSVWITGYSQCSSSSAINNTQIMSKFILY